LPWTSAIRRHIQLLWLMYFWRYVQLNFLSNTYFRFVSPLNVFPSKNVSSCMILRLLHQIYVSENWILNHLKNHYPVVRERMSEKVLLTTEKSKKCSVTSTRISVVILPSNFYSNWSNESRISSLYIGHKYITMKNIWQESRCILLISIWLLMERTMIKWRRLHVRID